MDFWMAAGAVVCDLFGDAEFTPLLERGERIGDGDAGGGGGGGERLVVGKRIDGDERVQLTEIGRLLKAGLVLCDEPAGGLGLSTLDTSGLRSRRNGFELSESLKSKGSKPLGDNDIVVMSMVSPVSPALYWRRDYQTSQKDKGPSTSPVIDGGVDPSLLLISADLNDTSTLFIPGDFNSIKRALARLPPVLEHRITKVETIANKIPSTQQTSVHLQTPNCTLGLKRKEDSTINKAPSSASLKAKQNRKI